MEKDAKLPSTRKLSETLNVSRNTVINAYEQLIAEGYIQSKASSGYFVSVTLPEQFFSADIYSNTPAAVNTALNINDAFAPGVPDLRAFPYSIWQKLLQRHSSRSLLSGNHDIQGLAELRQALADYLASSRSVSCTADDLIITSGAQQALTLATLATLGNDDVLLMENPGYLRVNNILKNFNVKSALVQVEPKTGIVLKTILNSDAKAVYLTPSNQYPMGITINLEQRLELLQWANQKPRWIIEDDYDSEFQFEHRPYASLQGLSAQLSQQQSVVYIGSMSKVMFNGLRLGYMVVPRQLREKCLALKDAMTGFTSPVPQAALADFISEGHLVRHIRKMRRLYEMKYQLMLKNIDELFGTNVEVISQPAGLHITLTWEKGISESTLSEQAKALGIIVRPLSYYESSVSNRKWQAVILGFGNIATEQIAPKLKQLANLFVKELSRNNFPICYCLKLPISRREE